jgi:hypothetical protein
MNKQEQTGTDIGQEQEQEQEQAAPTMADAAGLLAVLAESRMIGTGRKRSPRADYDAADVFADAAIELAQIAPAIIAEIVAAGIAGQTRQAPRESTIVPVNDSGELECTCGSNQIQELGQIAPGGLWWSYIGQDAATRVLRVSGWDWEGADGIGFECRDCHAEYDVLPEGWDVDYV